MKCVFSLIVLALSAGSGIGYSQGRWTVGNLRHSTPASQSEALSGTKVRALLTRNGSTGAVWGGRADGTLRFAAGFTSQSYSGTPESAAFAFLNEYAGLFGPSQPEFVISRVRTIGSFTVVRLDQTVDHIPVHGKDLVLTLDSGNSVRAVFANYIPAKSEGRPWLLERDQAAQKAITSGAGKNRRPLNSQQVWFVENDSLTPAWQVIVEEQGANGHPAHWSYLVSAENGEVLEAQDLRMGQSRQASAFVYPTNPLAGDITPITLGNLTDGVPYLFGTNAKIYSNLNVLLGLSDPGTVIALAKADASGNYPYKPWDPRHAEVQLYWAMDRATQNFRSVGYAGFGRPIEGVTEWADCSADGCVPQDNAFFNPIAFSGRGGIFVYYCRTGDPTYDTGVMFHEFTHAVVNDIVGSNQGSTFRALNEGTADYFSSSFLEDPADTPYAALIWGMRLPYLRTVANQNTYPRNLVGEAHLDGNIWSGALWELRKTLGASNTDTAVLLTLASISASAEFYDAAVAAVNVTALLYGHPAAAEAEKIFTTRGLLSASAEYGANPHFLRSGALPVVDSIAPADASGGILADRQFRFFAPPSATSFTLKLIGNNSNLVALLKHRSPVVIYNDGTTNADYVSDISSQITFNVNQSSDPEIQFGEYYLWVGHFNTQSSTEYAVYMRMQDASDNLLDIRLATLTPNGAPVSGSMPNGPILNSREFLVRVPESATGLGIKVEGETDMDLYLRYNSPVFYNNQGFPEADVVRASAASSEVAILTRNTVPNLTAGSYVVGVYNADDAYPSHFRVTAVTSTEPPASPKTVSVPARAPVSLQFPGASGAAILADTVLTIDVPQGTADLKLSLTTDLDARVYIRQGAPITFSKGWPVADFAFKTKDRKNFDVTSSSATPLKPGRYYVWIANASDAGGTVTISYTLL